MHVHSGMINAFVDRHNRERSLFKLGIGKPSQVPRNAEIVPPCGLSYNRRRAYV